MVAWAAIAGAVGVASDVSNVIQVGLQVNDALTPTLVEIQDETANTEQSVGRLSLRLDTLFTGLQNPALAFKATMSGVLGLFTNPGSLDFFTLAGQGFDFLKGKLSEAAQIQTTMLNTSASIASELGLTLSQSSQIAEKSISSLSQAAAALPGETADYAAIYRQISAQVAKNNPGNIEAFNTEATDLSTKLGVLSATGGMDASEVGRQSARFLSGTVSVGEFRNLQLGENPLLMNALQEELTAVGKSADEWSLLTLKQRTDIFTKSLEKAVPKELIASFEGTVESIFAGWDTILFDPTTGLLGVLRRVASVGDRNLLESFQGILQTLDRIKTSVADVLSASGLAIDPMEILIGAFDWLNVQLNRLQDFIEGNYSVDEIIKNIQDVPKFFAEWLVGASEFVLSFLDKLASSMDGEGTGKLMAQIYWLFEELRDQILTKIDWVKVGQIWAEFNHQKGKMEFEIWKEGLKMIPIRMGNAINGFTAGLIVWWNRDIMGGIKSFSKNVDSFIEGISSIFDRLIKKVEDFIPGLGGKKGARPLSVLGDIVNPLNVFKSIDYATKGKLRKKPEPKKTDRPEGSTSPIDGYKGKLPVPKTTNNNSKKTENKTNNISVNVQGTNASPQEIALAVVNTLNNQYAEASTAYG